MDNEWALYVGASKGKNAPVSVTLFGKYPTKRKMVAALRTINGTKHSEVVITGHRTYFTFVKA